MTRNITTFTAFVDTNLFPYIFLREFERRGNGGTGENRTRIRGFAVLYITILPPRQIMDLEYIAFAGNKVKHL